MVKVSGEVVQDAQSKNGRLIGIRWITDNAIINTLLKNPRIFRKTFPLNVTNSFIENEFRNTVTVEVNSAKSKLDEEGLSGKKIEFDV